MQLNLLQKLHHQSVGQVDFDLSTYHFDSADDFEVLRLCGHGYVVCNNQQTSPPVLVKTATSVRVQTLVAPAVYGLIAVGRNIGKRDL